MLCYFVMIHIFLCNLVQLAISFIIIFSYRTHYIIVVIHTGSNFGSLLLVMLLGGISLIIDWIISSPRVNGPMSFYF